MSSTPPRSRKRRSSSGFDGDLSEAITIGDFHQPNALLTLIVTASVFQIPSTVLMKLLNRTTIYDKQNILNTEPPFVLVSNHSTMLDDAFIGSLLFFPRAYADRRYMPFHTPEERNFYKGWLLSKIMEYSRCIPIRRDQGLYQFGLNRCIETLRAGNVVHIYPEGTRSRTGALGTPKPGVGRIICEANVPVVPCYHSGLERILPIGSSVPRIGKKVEIIVGPPASFTAEFASRNTPETWQAVSQQCMQMIQAQKNRLESLRCKPTPE